MNNQPKQTHQELGEELNLFFGSHYATGSSFMLPDGAYIYRKLEEYFRKQYSKLGYQEVMTPNLFNQDLWKKSGHWDKYKSDMFLVTDLDIEKAKIEDYKSIDDLCDLSIKPMNCPGDCLIFEKMTPSYRDLPIRLADFGILHRNESSGALTGLTRVRKFCQDDAHIFCRPDQLDQEIEGVIKMINNFYQLIGLIISVELSTRPEKYIGDLENWDKAEAILEKHIESAYSGLWKKNRGDGAFYGPKIDFHVTDSMGRSHQTATLQLDFNLPERFDLKYHDLSGEYERPILIHRAVLGSFERFIAILLEDTQGHLPFWLSPRQVAVIPINNKCLIDSEGNQDPFLKELEDRFRKIRLDFRYMVDLGPNNLNKKIKNSYKTKYCYQVILGSREMEKGLITLQDRSGKRVGEGLMSLDQMEEYFLNQLP